MRKKTVSRIGIRSGWFETIARKSVAIVALALVAWLIQPAVLDSFSSKTDFGLLSSAQATPASTLSVIVRKAAPDSNSAERLVVHLGGTVRFKLPMIDSFSAQIPVRALPSLLASRAVARVWADGTAHMASDPSAYDRMQANTAWQPVIQLQNVQKQFSGAGVGVALIDTGVVPMPDIVHRVVARVDFTPEGDGYDRYGHGTHMAGIIAGDGTSSGGQWVGVAPKANLISLKVAGYDGATDVSAIIAALQWAVSHRAQYNIRVANLSFGTDSTQSYRIDPLDYAVEQTWKAGILVVASAGNSGPSARSVTDPGNDPYVVTVGAADLNNTQTSGDDTIPSFSSRGPTQDGFSKPDLVAPGTTIVSVRDPNSVVDQLHSTARVGNDYFKGTGTSQAAAIVSGIAAMMFQAAPTMSPDVAKATLKGTVFNYIAKQNGAGAGLVNANGAVQAARNGNYKAKPANVGLVPSTGLGSLEASRGSLHVYADLNGAGAPELVTGEVDVLGHPWSATSWGANTWAANSWAAYTWNAVSWGAASWGGMSWGGMSWSAASWGAASWGGVSWGAASWGGMSWGDNSWSAASWGASSWGDSGWN